MSSSSFKYNHLTLRGTKGWVVFIITQGVRFGVFFLLFQGILVEKIPLQPSGPRISWHQMLHGSCSVLLVWLAISNWLLALHVGQGIGGKTGEQDRNTQEQRTKNTWKA